MNFDEKYSELMRNVLFERQGSIVLYPGGFKPPHKGHFEALKYLQKYHIFKYFINYSDKYTTIIKNIGIL